MQSFKLKSRWIWLLILVDAVILAVLAGFYFYRVRHLISYHFDAAQIAAYTKEEYEACFGGTIDENYESGLYDAVPGMFLRKGSYQYTLSYESTSPGSFAWPHSYSEQYDAAEQAITYFQDGTGTHTDEFWLSADLDMALCVYYSGTGSAAITGFQVWETPFQARIHLFYGGLVLLAANAMAGVYLYNKKHVIPNGDKYVFAGLASLCIFCSLPFFMGYATVGHDIYFHLLRIEGIRDGLLSGQFPVRINSVFYDGYGYANPIFYGELFLYIPAFFRLAGFPLSACYNIYGILINVLTCFGGYYCFKRIFPSTFIAMTVTVLYAMAPYRLVDMYVRAAVGEYTAMAFLPFIAYGLYRIYTEDVNRKEYKWSFLPLTVGLTGVIQTHVLTGEIVGFVILMVCVILFSRTFQKKRFYALVKTVTVTAVINLWFIVPFLDFMLTQDVSVFADSPTELVQDTGLFFRQMIALIIKYTVNGNYSAENGFAEEMPLTMGTALFLGLILCAVMLFFKNRDKKEEKKCGALMMVLSVLLSWMCTVYFPWDFLALRMPYLRRIITSIQFVWRFLSPVTLLATLATGFGLVLLRSWKGRRAGILGGAVLGVLTVIPALFFQVLVCVQAPRAINGVSRISTIGAAGQGEYTPSGVDALAVSQVLDPRVYGGSIESYEKQGTNISLTVKRTDESCYVLLPLWNYKGYRVTSGDGSVTNGQLSTGDNMVMRIDIPPGSSGRISVRYVGFWYWRLAEIASVAGIVLLAAFLYKDKRKARL